MISVIIPNYNHAPYLRERIDSVLNQSFQDFELIIMDDCSTDYSKDIIENYRNDPKISQIIYNDHNSGSTFKQWKKGIESTKGDFIWIAESDDVADPNLLATLYDNITKENNIVLSYSQSFRMNSSGEITGTWKEQVRRIKNGENFFSQNFICSGISFIQDFLLNKNVIPNASAVLFRKSAYFQVNGVDLDVKACSDWLLWLKILTVGKLAFSSTELNYFRFHDQSVIATVFKNESLVLCCDYDIIVRKKYNTFLANNHLDSLIKPNTDFIERDYIADVFECFREKAYIKSMKMFWYAFIYSNNKTKLINKVISFLSRRNK